MKAIGVVPGLSVPSHAALDAARRVGDESADRCVSHLGHEVWAVNAVLRGVRSNHEPVPESLPQELRDFLLTHVVAPAWLSRARVFRAQSWAERHLLHITVALFCASLPSAYAAERGARVLMATKRMATDLDRRVNETARFVLDVLARGSLDHDGTALSAIRKVRLMHAAVRLLLRERTEFAEEVPINQEDLLGTLLSFSVLVIGSVRRMGVEVDATDAEDFYHLWRGVGVMLGLRDEMLPRDFASASQASDRIAQRQFRPSAHGQALMAELLKRTEAHFDLPGLRSAPRLVVRHLLGDHTADLLGVPASSVLEATFMRSNRTLPVGRWSQRAISMHLAPRLGRPLLEALVSVKLGRAQAAFLMPTDLGPPDVSET